MSHRALLAFSGGLDTSYCVIWLREQGHEVHTVTVDTGGFGPAELERIHNLALALGAATHTTIDARAELFDDYLRHLVAGNVLRGGLYPLSVSAERVCQAKRVVAYAKEIGATALVHGSTGAGNDQVRFDVAFRALAPEMTLMAPIRELAPSRAEERAFLSAHGFEFPEKLESYSVNEGMWGTSVGGKETLDPWQCLPDAAFPGGAVDPALAPKAIVIGFERGVPTSLDGMALTPVALIQALNELGALFGIGRGIHLGDTIMGIKGRVGFEAPAAHLLIAAHRELEKLVLTGKQLFWKESLGNLYGGLLHEGHFFDPLCRDLEAFLDSSQETVTGEVRVRLQPNGFMVEGVRSPRALVRPDMASYGESTRLWSGAEAAGFAKIFGVPQMVALKARS
jgi:argininosuccinate synthase